MKNIFLIGLTIIFIGNHSKIMAQKNKMVVGIEAGPNISSFRYTNNSSSLADNKFVMYFSSGLSLQYNLMKDVSLKTGIAFEKKGNTAITKTCLGEDIINNSGFYYVTVPLMLRKTFGRKINFFVNGGSFISYLGKEKLKIKRPDGEKSEATQTGNYKKFDFGITTGAGAFIPIKDKFQFSFEIRDNLGLNNISDVFMIDGGTVKTNTLNLILGVGYKF